MSFLSVLMIGIGLSMDACAVSFAKGMCMKKGVLKYALLLGITFGAFQAGMPLLGWWVGTYFQSFISSVDHWIAFVLLALIGFNMIKESRGAPETCESDPKLDAKSIVVLAIATSIDALAVGISFAFLQVDIVMAISVIGITTFVISFLAVLIGNRIGGMMGKYAEILGGVILIGIGLKILIEHLNGLS